MLVSGSLYFESLQSVCSRWERERWRLGVGAVVEVRCGRKGRAMVASNRCGGGGTGLEEEEGAGEIVISPAAARRR